MAEKNFGLIRSVTAYLSRYVKGRRRLLLRGERFESRLPFIITLLGTGRRARSLGDTSSLVGHTRDMSETGLTLLLPSVRVGDAYLTDVGSRLEVKLELPGGPVTMIAHAVRFEQLTHKEAGCGYLLAVSIIKMQSGEHDRYIKYLKDTGRKRKHARESVQAQAATHDVLNGNPQLGTWDALTPASVDKAFEQFLRK